MPLKSDYKDAMYDGQRRYRLVQNEDGTYSLPDATTYTQAGDKFGANDINAVTGEINKMQHTVRVALPASGWTGSAAPYSQTVAVAGITGSDTPVLVKALAGAETEAAVKAYNKAFGFIFAGETADGNVTFKAYKKPSTDITVELKGV